MTEASQADYDRILADLVQAETERDRYRAALKAIADERGHKAADRMILLANAALLGADVRKKKR